MLTDITRLELWNNTFFGIQFQDIFFAFGLFLVFLLLLQILHIFVIGKLKKFSMKTKTEVDNTFVKILETIRLPFYIFIAFYLSIKLLNLPENITHFIDGVFLVWIVYQVILAVQVLIDFIAKKKIAKEDEETSKSAIELVGKIAKITVWVIGLLLILSNLGINITSLIAGLGIGGIAIAFALQNVLGDLFSSFAIYFDKPFKVGDFIIVGDQMGTVQKIGIKTTRIQALQGEEIIMANQELTSARIHNYKRMTKRRIPFMIGVVYETPAAKIKKIPGIIRDIIKSIDGAEFDRAHFKSFESAALTFEIVYYVTSGEYNIYMDIQQKINIKIKESLEKEKIALAYPTQTIYLEKNQIDNKKN